jgi:hypothetical protein
MRTGLKFGVGEVWIVLRHTLFPRFCSLCYWWGGGFQLNTAEQNILIFILIRYCSTDIPHFLLVQIHVWTIWIHIRRDTFPAIAGEHISATLQPMAALSRAVQTFCRPSLLCSSRMRDLSLVSLNTAEMFMRWYDRIGWSCGKVMEVLGSNFCRGIGRYHWFIVVSLSPWKQMSWYYFDWPTTACFQIILNSPVTLPTACKITHRNVKWTDHSGSAVKGMNCLHSLDRWGLGFESHSSLGSRDVLIPRPRSPTDCV